MNELPATGALQQRSPKKRMQDFPHLLKTRFSCQGGTAACVCPRLIIIQTLLCKHQSADFCKWMIKMTSECAVIKSRGERVYSIQRPATVERKSMTMWKCVGGVCDLSLFLTAVSHNVEQKCTFHAYYV